MRLAKATILLFGLALCVPTAMAQKKDPRVNPPAQPIPPLGANESSSTAPADAAGLPAPSQEQGSSPIGVNSFKVGSGVGGRNLLVIGFNLYQGGDTNPQSRTDESGAVALSQFGGDLAFQRIMGRSQFSADYVGSGSIYSTRSELNTSNHGLTLSLQRENRSSRFQLSNALSYSPDAYGSPEFGLGEASRLVDVDRFFRPDQSIATERAARISNTVAGSTDFFLSRRSSLTFSGSFGLLRFLEEGFTDSRTISVRAGHSYQWTGRDALSVSYGVNLIRFDGTGSGLDTHTAHVSYSRRISGRLAFQVGGGPQITNLDQSFAGRDRLISTSVSTSLNYKWPRSNMGLSYSRGVTNGSGVSRGAVTDRVDFSISHPLGRIWSASWGVGYSLNQTERITGIDNRFNTWQANTRVGRAFGRHTNMDLTYSLQNQQCSGPQSACGFTGFRHIFGIAFRFRLQPIELD